MQAIIPIVVEIPTLLQVTVHSVCHLVLIRE